MGSGEKRHHHHLHLHHHQQQWHENKDIPRGCVTVLVGQGEEQQKFVIPVMHINHPLFIQLLKEAEKEYGFHHNGPINIPCHVEEFRYVEGIIDKDSAAHHHHHHHHHHHYLWTCFKA
ncbi:auxin-responsive protein saur32 [Nicotiana attenuata]|uniref:Auxin-responsive protein saur32 n=1 Tax=Nicotiana attenuata TaxID=49451 RepID=A0A1J6JXW6_NICAT|nr:auxin-responsive protein saur32 [Nicotiana attenuata]